MNRYTCKPRRKSAHSITRGLFYLCGASIYFFFFPNGTGASNPDENIVYFSGTAEPISVMLTGHQKFEKLTPQLAEKLSLKDSEPEKEIPKDLLPERLRISTLELLTPRKRTMVKIKNATLRSGCAFWQFHLRTDQASDSEFPEGIARLGEPFPKTAQLRKISGVPGTDPSVSKIAPNFKVWVESKLPQEERERYQRLNVTLADFRFEKGTFSQKGRWLVWAGLAYSEERQQASEMSFKVAAILDTFGKPLETLERPYPGEGDGLGGWSPMFGIDIDSDGIEEIVYQTSYYEGGSVLIRHVRKGIPTNTILMSDGC